MDKSEFSGQLFIILIEITGILIDTIFLIESTKNPYFYQNNYIN